ncbi:MAG: hypothetical protein L0H83_01795, partial [Salinisphaera sp.]|nr:hypothetical protein [Salinisphaera sp.]
ARLRALADQANLVLGYWLLDMARPASARKAFLRVRMSNPAHAAKAMLGLGWAQFGAVKLPMVLSSVDPRDCDVDEQIWEEDAARAPPRWECRMREYSEDRRLLDFVYLRMGKQTQYERAVIAWREAAAHGKLPDPVVAEALAVLPFSLAAAGDQKGAEGAFRSAIAKLGAARLKLAGTPVDPAPRPHSPLARLRQETQAMRARIATLRQRLTQLHQPAAAAQRALDNIGQVLAQLRAAGDGPGYAAPSPLQRGRLRLALTTLDPFAGSRAQASERLTFAQAQLQRLSDRLQAAADQIPRLATRNQRQKIAAQRARLDAYLRQARMGLAGVLKIAQD